MKLLSYVNDKCQWGFLVEDPVSEEELVIDLAAALGFLNEFCGDRTVGYFLNRPNFFPAGVPATLLELLEGGETAMREAEKLQRFCKRFLAQSDRSSLLGYAGHRLNEITFLAPIPEPRLLWGLVGNVPSFARCKWPMKQLQLVPQGHQRPLGTVVAHRVKTSSISTGGNAELGIIIGRRARNVSMENAMQYVAGFTVVNDMCQGLYAEKINALKAEAGDCVADEKERSRRSLAVGSPVDGEDIYGILSASWSGKYADRMCGIGPWMVTPDEVGDVYDLIATCCCNDQKLGRGHTGSLLVGVERAISYYSRFATLFPGDIIHFGAVGKDGYGVSPEAIAAGEGVFSAEFEGIGRLELHTVFHDKAAEAAAPPRRRQTVPAAPQSPADLDAIRLRNFYLVYGNSRRPGPNGLQPRPYPRFLCVPGSAVGSCRAPSEFNTPELSAGAEVCAVIGRTIRGCSATNVMEAVAGIAPMLVLENRSLQLDRQRARIAFDREWALPEMYGRWGDASNLVPDSYLPEVSPGNLVLRLDTPCGSQEYRFSDYVLGLTDVLSFINSYITLYPGDVVSLGALGEAIDLAPELERRGSVALSLRAGEVMLQKEVSWREATLS